MLEYMSEHPTATQGASVARTIKLIGPLPADDKLIIGLYPKMRLAELATVLTNGFVNFVLEGANPCTNFMERSLNPAFNKCVLSLLYCNFGAISGTSRKSINTLA